MDRATVLLKKNDVEIIVSDPRLKNGYLHGFTDGREVIIPRESIIYVLERKENGDEGG